NIRYLPIVLPERYKMFYPFTTKNGKLSFRMNDYFLYAQFENVAFSGEQIFFSGYFNFPPTYKTDDYEIIDLDLVVTTNRIEERIEVPLEQCERKDLYDRFNGNENLLYTGVKGTFNFREYISLEEQVNFKFYLNMT